MKAATRASSPFMLLPRWQTRQQRRPVRPMCDASSLCIGLSPSIASTHGTMSTSSPCSQSQTVKPSSRTSLRSLSKRHQSRKEVDILEDANYFLEHLQRRRDVRGRKEMYVPDKVSILLGQTGEREEETVMLVPFFGNITRGIVAVIPARKAVYTFAVCLGSPFVWQRFRPVSCRAVATTHTCSMSVNKLYTISKRITDRVSQKATETSVLRGSSQVRQRKKGSTIG